MKLKVVKDIGAGVISLLLLPFTIAFLLAVIGAVYVGRRVLPRKTQTRLGFRGWPID